jgi:hypothetical protein
MSQEILNKLNDLKQFVKVDDGLLNVLTGALVTVVKVDKPPEKLTDAFKATQRIETGELNLSFQKGSYDTTSHDFSLSGESLDKFVVAMQLQSVSLKSI